MMEQKSTVIEHARTMPLIDQHCHGLVRNILSRNDFEDLSTESDWPTPAGKSVFDSPFGVAIRAECGPALGLEKHCSAEDYLSVRFDLGPLEVARRLLTTTGITDYLVETGHRSDDILTPDEMATLAGAQSKTVVRLEPVAEDLARDGVTAADFADAYAASLLRAAKNAVGLKTIIAYRYGLDFDPARPSVAEVSTAAAEWLAHCERTNTWRLDHPVLLRAVLWAGVDLAMPIQVHVGYGDSDIVLHRCDPTHLTAFLKATVSTGVRFTLLHCYPFIREAGYLAQVYPHVFFDTGAAINFTGASSLTLVRESLELSPFSKLLFSTDAFGLPELYQCGALLFRRHAGRVFAEWVASDSISEQDAIRYLTMIGSGNAAELYGLAPP